MRFSMCILGMLLGASCAEAPRQPDLTPAVEAMLAASATSWNRGDLTGFMQTYLVDSATAFVTRDGVHYGYDWIHERYAPRFAPGAERDSLRFERVATRRLGTAHALATAHYVLFRGDSITATGPFTVVLVHTPDGWKMIHDHTS